MSHLRRIYRIRTRFGGDHSHERARRLAAERLAEPLSPEDDDWLAAHLAACLDCAALAAEYEDAALGLRAARGVVRPVPPDLRARVDAALDEEARSAPRADRTAPLVPVGLLAGAMVIGVVAASTILSTGPVEPAAAPSPLPPVALAPTPLPVAADRVAWFAPAPDGSYSLRVAAISDVCTAETEACAPLTGGETLLRLSAAPRAVVGSPTGDAIAVLEAGTERAGGAIWMVRLPAAAALGGEPPPPGEAAPDATAPAPGEAAPATEPTIIPIASAPPSPAELPDGPAASAGPSASEGTAVTTAPAGTNAPAPVGSTEPSATSSPGPSAMSSPVPPASGSATTGPTGSASAGDLLAIATGIVVDDPVGYSPDGSWFAFTARPADGSHGPDIWAWRVGDLTAGPLTDDHRSVFASWAEGLVVGSRAEPRAGAAGGATDGTTGGGAPDAEPSPSVADASGATTVQGGTPYLADPVSFLLDPATGGRVDLALPAWRPTVDPLGRWVVYWSGTLAFDAERRTWDPADGGPVIAPWPTLVASAGTAAPDPEPGIDATAGSEAATGPEAPASPETPATVPPGPVPLPGLDLVAGGALPTDWEVHWEPTGIRLAIWLGDPLDRSLGRLSLLVLDPWSGTIDPAASLLRDEPARPGISLETGRLAWATPAGQDGEGSRLQVLAWGPAGSGQLDSEPVAADGAVVVVR